MSSSVKWVGKTGAKWSKKLKTCLVSNFRFKKQEAFYAINFFNSLA